MSARDESGLVEWFQDLEKQDHAARLGMWLFLASEVLLFAGLFGIYACYRATHAVDFLAASRRDNLAIGTANTVVLITSSFSVAWAIHSLGAGRSRSAERALAVTLGLAATFLVLKGLEYRQHFADGIFPAGYYRFPELPTSGARLFFTLYYFMTGLHALHVIGGMVALTIMLVRVRRRSLTPTRYLGLELAGLYWHMVDAIWIFLWPLLYLAW